MLQDPVTIKSQDELPASLDYQGLLDEAISLAQQLSGNIWTDYNAHDPGVTLLTQLCYALTEIGYRTDVDLQRLLYYDLNTREQRLGIERDNAFFPAHEIYPTGPTTLDDYRIVLIDEVDEVADAWVMPISNDRYGFKGLYKVILQLKQSNALEKESENNSEEQIVAKARRILSANRNLCEDLETIEVLQGEPITFKAKLELKTDSVEEEVLATVFKRIQDYFTPPTNYAAEESLRQKGLANHEIFAGPTFNHGFIESDSLTEYGRIFYLSKMAELISTVPGVWNLKNFEVYLGNVQLMDDKIELAENHFPYLNLEAFIEEGATFSLELTKGGISTSFNTTAVEYYLDSQKNRGDKSYDLSSKEKGRSIPRTKGSDLRHFESIQNTFPALYGIGQYGRRTVIMNTHQKTDSVKDGHVKQLQGFLYFFDQFLANHLEQLSSVRDLFSIKDQEKTQSYFSQLFHGIDSSAEFNDLTKSDVLEEKTNDLFGYYSLLRNGVQEELEKLRKDRDPAEMRVDRVLTHLLSRFGEDFPSDKLSNLMEFFEPGDSIKRKKEFLRNISSIGRKRAQGFDYLRPSFEISDSQNTAGFMQKLRLILNLTAPPQSSLVCSTTGEAVSISDVKAKETKRHKDNYDEVSGDLAHFPIVVRKDRSQKGGIKNVDHLPYLFKFGTVRKNYQIVQQGKSVNVLYTPFETKTGFKLFGANSEDEADERILRLIDFLRAQEELCTGVHVVEHILLRPMATDQHRFVVRDKSGKELFESISSGSKLKQFKLAESVIEAGLSKTNYVVEPTTGDKFNVILQLKGKNVAKAVQPAISQEQALDRIDNVYVSAFKKYQKGFDPAVTILTPLDESNIVVPDPMRVNHQLTLVIPNWVSRFQNKDFVKFLKMALKDHLPACCQCELSFVSNKEMIRFEKLYKSWLDAKSTGEDLLKIDGLSEKLGEFLNLISSDE